MAGPLTSALDTLEEQMRARPFNAWAVRSAFYGVKKVIGFAPDVNDLRRMFEACMFALDLSTSRRPAIEDEGNTQSLIWAVEACLHDVLIDHRRERRDYTQHSVTRHLGLGRPPYAGEPAEPVPLVHLALPEVEAKALIAPYLRYLEAGLIEEPLAHLKLCWDVFENPVPPFHCVFDQWLTDMDARHGTCDLSALRRAMALTALARGRQQRLSWPDCAQYLIPQLHDPHPLVAAAAGRYLGMLYSDPTEMFVFSTPPPVAQIMAQIAALPQSRRFVAGGFLNGYDDLNPFAALREDKVHECIDIKVWVLAVLEDRTPERHLPSAQSFWFYVHEAFCFDPAFINQMIDAGHLWEALMTATEMQEMVVGMRPVLERLAACLEPSIARAAQLCLERHYNGRE